MLYDHRLWTYDTLAYLFPELIAAIRCMIFSVGMSVRRCWRRAALPHHVLLPPLGPSGPRMWCV